MSDRIFDAIGFACAAFGAIASAIASFALIGAIAAGAVSGLWWLAVPVFLGCGALGGYIATDLAHEYLR